MAAAAAAAMAAGPSQATSRLKPVMPKNAATEFSSSESVTAAAKTDMHRHIDSSSSMDHRCHLKGKQNRGGEIIDRQNKIDRERE